MRHSLRVRLIVWILALVVPASAAAGWLLVRLFADRLVRDVDVALEEEAATVAALLDKPGDADMMTALLSHISAETDLGSGKRIVVRRGAQIIGEAPAGAGRFLAGHESSPGLRIASARAGPADDPLTIQIAVPTATAAHATKRLHVLLAIGIPCAVLLLAGGLSIVIGRALRPLEDASQRMESITVADLTTRVPVNNPHDEVGRMVQVLNRLLDRLAGSMQQTQRFTADAAHELRTPLTVLRTGLEIALARPRSAAEYRAAIADAVDATERLAHVGEELLTLARLDAAAPPPAATRIDVAELLQDLSDAWAARAAARGVVIEVASGPPSEVRGAAADLYRLFNNVIENALRHSPHGGRVRLNAGVEGAWVRITVTDDGPGIAADEAAKVFDRFYRGGAETQPGSGLGLSIARSIAHAHGGEITLHNAPQGGCCASVVLAVAG